MGKSRRQFEEWSDGKDLYNISPFDIWKASRESLINGLEPVGYITSSGFDNIKEYGYTHLNEERSEKINIPLYKLD
ncbi:hypothetical protein R2S03_07900 [Hafnia alvei]|uniref:hypothetical protein n=1 Tax=Proteus vulgaris TaxID=585 RepID=UPI00299D09F2|nr:hypothetical protein [Proteus vulgaris]WOO51067.1 hypothetical protein R2S03_07900 [Hafnia alvei]WPF05539.1 hypothetical protein SB028_06745 [Proteus vulgaris]